MKNHQINITPLITSLQVLNLEFLDNLISENCKPKAKSKTRE